MAVPASVDEFLDLVRKSAVTDEKRFDAYVARARAGMPNDPTKVAMLLIQEGILTNFQAENILAGKWRRFTIGKYKVLERLGSGGFAQVYLCEHKLMRRRVAVKVLPVAKAKNSSALERFYREAREAAKLDHPNIVHTYDIDQDADLHFIVMEYIDGANLQQIVTKSGPMSVARAANYIHQAACGLQHAHESGLVHRDIKPGNILVDRTGVVQVLDMGLALNLTVEDEFLTKKFEDGTLGTADYLSPEQAIDSHAVDIRTDIYSLGVTFYFLLAGKPPFDGIPLAQKLLAHQMKQPPSLATLRPDVPAELLAVIDKMMAKRAEDRYATPGDVADALAPFTQVEVAPPSDDELPRLSPAATGIPSSPETAQVKPITPRPPAGPAMKRVEPVTPAKTRPAPAHAPMPTAAVATAPPVPSAKPAAPELAPWEQAAHDTDNPAMADTASRSELELPTDNTPRKMSKKAMIIVGVLVMAFVVLPIIVIAGIFGTLWIFFPTKPPPPPPPPQRLEVSRDPARKAYTSIRQALQNAKVGATIELWDDTYEENVVVDPARGMTTSVTLQAAPGKEIVWRSGRNSDPAQPILWLAKAGDFKLKGKGIVLDGTLGNREKVNDLLMITSHNPDMSVEDLQFKSFARSAVLIMNGAGGSQSPIRLHRLWTVTQDGEKPRSAIYFDANPQVTPAVNDNIEIVDLKCVGIEAANFVQSRDPAVLGKNVSWPGR